MWISGTLSLSCCYFLVDWSVSVSCEMIIWLETSPPVLIESSVWRDLHLFSCREQQTWKSRTPPSVIFRYQLLYLGVIVFSFMSKLFTSGASFSHMDCTDDVQKGCTQPSLWVIVKFQLSNIQEKTATSAFIYSFILLPVGVNVHR